MIEPTIEPLYQPDEIERVVRDLGKRLSDELGPEDPLFLGLIGGSVIFLADLVRAYAEPVRFELVHVGYRHPEVSASDLLAIQYPIPVDLDGQSLVVVKDVIASGVTETYLAEQFLEKGASRVRFVALIDVEDERKTDLDEIYAAFSIQRTGPLVGYGLKYRGRYGNLPYVGQIADGD